MPTRPAQEPSPSLPQHRDNPVDWYPWGPEALGRAREEDRPILLSVGYSACHWCHVMERESFEDPETASYMNAHFVNVKVDREERPDVDAIYMEAVQAMSGHGGWPRAEPRARARATREPLGAMGRIEPTPDPPEAAMLVQAVESLRAAADLQRGGIGARGPQVPPSPALELLMARDAGDGDARGRPIVESTLDAMMAGGIYDQVGGG